MLSLYVTIQTWQRIKAYFILALPFFITDKINKVKNIQIDDCRKLYIDNTRSLL